MFIYYCNVITSSNPSTHSLELSSSSPLSDEVQTPDDPSCISTFSPLPMLTTPVLSTKARGKRKAVPPKDVE